MCKRTRRLRDAKHSFWRNRCRRSSDARALVKPALRQARPDAGNALPWEVSYFVRGGNSSGVRGGSSPVKIPCSLAIAMLLPAWQDPARSEPNSEPNPAVFYGCAVCAFWYLSHGDSTLTMMRIDVDDRRRTYVRSRFLVRPWTRSQHSADGTHGEEPDVRSSSIFIGVAPQYSGLVHPLLHGSATFVPTG